MHFHPTWRSRMRIMKFDEKRDAKFFVLTDTNDVTVVGFGLVHPAGPFVSSYNSSHVASKNLLTDKTLIASVYLFRTNLASSFPKYTDDITFTDEQHINLLKGPYIICPREDMWTDKLIHNSIKFIENTPLTELAIVPFVNMLPAWMNDEPQ